MNKYTFCSSLALLISLLLSDVSAIDKDPLEDTNPTVTKPSFSKDCFKHYADFYKAVMENPDNFQWGSDQYKTLLKYIVEGYISVDLEALELLPDINKVDLSKNTISDFDKHCLLYLIVHKIDHVRSVLPQLKANTNDDSCLYLLIVYYKNNTEDRHDTEYKEEFLSYIQSAEKRPYKSPHLLNTLSFLYQEGKLVKKNEETAFDYMEQAAKTGMPIIQSNLAFMYQYGKGVSQSYEKAIELYQKAADQGNALALTNLGSMYKNGQGVPQNYEKAIKSYQKAIDRGSAAALNNLGFMYAEGLGVSQSYQKAVELYQKAANQRNVPALNNLAFMYKHGRGVSQSYEKAIELYQKAADQGNKLAIYNLAFMYEHGQGVSQNYKKAIELYKNVAHQGDVDAQNNLGFIYQQGLGVSQSYEEAIYWYQKAADQGCESAFENLCDLYSLDGQFQDFEKAEYWRLKGLKPEDRFSGERQHFPDLSAKIDNKNDAEAVKKDIEADINWLIGMFGLFEGKLDFDNKNSNLDQGSFSSLLDQKFFSDLNNQLATMKNIFKGYTSPDFMNPYVNVSQGFKRQSLDAKRAEKWLDVYRYQNTEFWSFGKEGNDLFAQFADVLNDTTIEHYLKKAWPSMKKMIIDFSKDPGQEEIVSNEKGEDVPDVTDQEVVILNENDEEIGDLADSYRAVKQRFVEFILATADLRNPRFLSK